MTLIQKNGKERTFEKAPFPWFGGKSRAAHLVWPRFGDVANYVEPFAGSLAVLLKRPHYPFAQTRIETVNDRDAFVANFWRAIQSDPGAVVQHADNPVNEADLHARHAWLHAQAGLVEKIMSDPKHYDAKVAGYWVYGLSTAIGDEFTSPKKLNSIPQMGSGSGVHRQSLRGCGCCRGRRSGLLSYFRTIQDRLRGVRVSCGNWTRVCSPMVTTYHGLTGILFDPPYSQDHGCATVYGENHERTTSAEVRNWCIDRGEDKQLRIALCGYDTEHGEMEAHGWTVVSWKAAGDYGSQRKDKSNQNKNRERIWFSPHCLKATD